MAYKSNYSLMALYIFAGLVSILTIVLLVIHGALGGLLGECLRVGLIYFVLLRWSRGLSGFADKPFEEKYRFFIIGRLLLVVNIVSDITIQWVLPRPHLAAYISRHF
jgi:hypothetical protein